MKTDKITVTNAGQGMAEAVDQAAAAAAYRGLTGKEKVHLRLLAEEMLGMLRQIADRGRFLGRVGGKTFSASSGRSPSHHGRDAERAAFRILQWEKCCRRWRDGQAAGYY